MTKSLPFETYFLILVNLMLQKYNLRNLKHVSGHTAISFQILPDLKPDSFQNDFGSFQFIW